MSVACQSSLPLSREHCVLLTLRAWLNTIVPLTIGELNAKVQNLGRPAKNLIARSGGILEFLKLCPELTVSNQNVEISLSSASSRPGELHPREISARLNQLSTSDINILNRSLTKLQIGSKSSQLVSALQKREQLLKMKRQCEIKRSEIEELRQRVRANFPEDSRDAAVERLNDLENLKIAALRRLSEKEVFIEEKVRLEKLLTKLDKEIEAREDKLGRLNLKILYNQEKSAMFEQDLFFESRQHETLTHELLEQHSSDSKKLAKVFEVLVREKCGHSEAVLEAYIRALEKSGGTENRASRSCHQKLAEVKQRQEEYLKRIREHRIDLQMISQLELVTIDSIQLPLFGEKVAEVPNDAGACPAAGSVANSGETSCNPVAKEQTKSVCAICLTDLCSAPSERLKCSHDFHSSCLEEMYSSGASHCPLCRQFEPSQTDFPTL